MRERDTEESSEGGLGSLDDLAERHRAGGERKHGEGVGGSGAEGHGDAGKDVILRGLGHLARIGCRPEEEGVDHAHAELQRGDGQGEPGRAAGGLERHLVADVVIVVAEVPECEVEDELDVDVELLLAGGARHLSHRVRRLRLGGLRQQGHGAGRAEALTSEEHVGAALRDAGHIAAGAEKGVGLRGQDMHTRHGVQGAKPPIREQRARTLALCTRASHRGRRET